MTGESRDFGPPIPPPRPPDGRVDVPDGQIAYWLDGLGSPVLMIQGVGVAGCGWAPQVEAARTTHQCCTFDNRGIGHSRGRPRSVQQMAGDALAVMDHLGWQRAHVVGHSLGGAIAQALLVAAPHRLHSLALLCTVEVGRAALQLDPASVWRSARCQLGRAAARRRAFFRLVSPARMHAAEEEHVRELEFAFGRRLHALPPAALRQVLALFSFRLAGRREALGNTPCLVLSAREDFVCPPSQGVALAEVLGTTCVVLEGGHAVVVQDAATVNRALAELWAR